MANPSDSDHLLFFNGVNGATGEYGLPPMTGEELSRLIQGEATPDDLNELRFREGQKDQGHFGVKEGADPKRLDQAGWGVVFAPDADPAVREALAPLLRLRRQQAGERFKVFEQGGGYRPGEAKAKFLARHGAGPGPADPARVPYYLLLVGSPETIPYRFQSQLDVQYAVGRLHFDTAEEYAHYAESVVRAERAPVELARRVSFFGVANDGDKATRLSTEHLVTPLVEYLRQRSDWQVDACLGEQATKANLARLLGGADTPALVFTASHGMEFPNGHGSQIPHQGALLCQDWPGPKAWRRPIPQDFYFAADDLASDAQLLGLISFHFACYGAGTPKLDEFAKQAFKERAAIAPHAFLAALPTKMLSHPRGGALAVIGHVERAWGYSFLWQGAGSQTTVFESALDRLLDGHPVGSALEYFDQRYAELSTVLADQLEEIEFGAEADPYELAGMWTANNDARGYVILGDPAVRLNVAEPGAAARQRSVLGLESVTPPPPPARGSAEESGGAEPEPDAASFSIPETAEVHFKAYHPSALAVGERRRLLVYGHLLAALEAVAADAGQVLGQADREYRQAAAEASTAIAPGTEITVVPRAEGLSFEPSEARLVWSGAWQRADFEMAATGERVGHVIEGSIACYVGPLLIADIRLPVVVVKESGEAAGDQPAGDAERTVQSAKVYQSVFASYSHDDTPIVEAMEIACQAMGMDYLRDVMTLKSGQSWSDELLQMIERADVFQLFWSPGASRSPYVEQEWRHALELTDRKGGAFIRPIYWDKPLAPVPGALSHIHFAPIDVAAWLGRPGPSLEPTMDASTAIAALAPGGVEELTSLTVSTYAADDPADPKAVSLKVRTEISLPGDVEVYLAEGLADEDYLAIHEKTVREALRARLAYLELVAGRKPG